MGFVNRGNRFFFETLLGQEGGEYGPVLLSKVQSGCYENASKYGLELLLITPLAPLNLREGMLVVFCSKNGVEKLSQKSLFWCERL